MQAVSRHKSVDVLSGYSVTLMHTTIMPALDCCDARAAGCTMSLGSKAHLDVDHGRWAAEVGRNSSVVQVNVTVDPASGLSHYGVLASEQSLCLDAGAGKHLKTAGDPMYRGSPGYSIERGAPGVRPHGNKDVAGCVSR
jgi:hypothetical protein